MFYRSCMSNLRTIFLTIVICAIALTGGTVSALYALNNFEGFNQLTIGQWHASPLYGSADADPYSRAQRSRAALLPLGTAEGQRFVLRYDTDGAKLDPRCDYSLQGKVPSSRFWTLHASDLTDNPLLKKQGLPQALHSQTIWYGNDSSLHISVSSTAQAGNWLAINTTHPYQLVLTLYDTALGSSVGFENPQMPELKRVSSNCKGAVR